MAYPEISPILSFAEINTHNTLTLGIADTSFYPDEFVVSNPTYEITPPNYAKATIVYERGQLLILNSNTLNITCVADVSQLTDLPDGIWTIRQSISPAIDFNIQRTFIRTMKLEQKLGKAFLRTDITQCGQQMKLEQMKVINEATFYLQAAIAAANTCNNKLAMELYSLAGDIINDFIKTGNKSWC